MEIEYFGHIDCNRLDSYYATEIDLDGIEIKLDLNFEAKSIASEALEQLNSRLKNLKPLIAKTWEWIKADYETGYDVKEYLAFHLEDFFEDNLEEILQGTDINLSYDKRFLQTLKVRRIGFYPLSNNYLIFDYMTNENLSNYILVVYMNEKLELECISVES